MRYTFVGHTANLSGAELELDHTFISFYDLDREELSSATGEMVGQECLAFVLTEQVNLAMEGRPAVVGH